MLRVLLVQNRYVKVFKNKFFSPYQDRSLLGVVKSVPERCLMRMWGQRPGSNSNRKAKELC